MAPMKKILPTLIASLAALAFAAPAANAGLVVEDATEYYLTTDSFINVFDDEPFTSEWYGFYVGDMYLGRVWGKDTKVFKFSRCAGGEVRIEVDVLAQRLNKDNSTIRVQYRLYEGTSCSTKDLESKVTKGDDNLPTGLNNRVRMSDTLFNEDDGDDRAVLGLSITSKQLTYGCNC
jgi:hypothetical protein